MHKIERLLQTLAPKGVEFRKLGDIGEFTRGNGLLKSDLQDKGRPVVHYGQIHTQYNLSIDKTISYVNDALFHKLKKAKPNDILIATTSENVKDVGKSIAWLGNEEVVFSGEMYSYSTNENPKFIVYYFQTWFFQKEKEKKITGTKVMRIHGNDLKKITIPIPPLEIQQEIVKILDAFTELNTELNTELKARKKQYQYYQNMLLDFNDINQNHKDAKEKLAQKPYPKRLKTLLQTLAPKGVEFRKIGELFKRNKGINITAAQMKELHSEIGKVRIFAGGATKADINYKDISEKDIINCESVIIKSRGNIGFEYYNQPFSHKNEIWSYSSKTNQMLVKFLYYYLSNNQYYFQKLAQSSSVKLPQLSVSDTDEYKFPIPPLEIQQEIVKILDQFSALTTDLQAGIPAEIEARKKQYEYYREKLLSFKPLTPHKEVKKG